MVPDSSPDGDKKFTNQEKKKRKEKKKRIALLMCINTALFSDRKFNLTSSVGALGKTRMSLLHHIQYSVLWN